jgi:hypothetical protein
VIQKLIFLVMDKNCLPNKYFNLNFKVNVFEQKKINYKKKLLMKLLYLNRLKLDYKKLI